MTHDVAIAGLGAMGSAAAYVLAARGRRVIGFDRFKPPHANGSSHGKTRMIREAYFERPQYVPLVQRAYECWQDLERRSGQHLLMLCGGLAIGPRGARTPEGARASAEVHGLTIDLLTARELEQRFPAFRLDDDMIGVWEPRGGILFPEACVAVQLALAEQYGAALAFDEPVLEWKPDGAGVTLRTTRSEYKAGCLILAAGPWIAELLPALSLPLRIERNVVHWFHPTPGGDAFSAERFPVFIIEHAPDAVFYGFPDLGDGVKVARHHQGRPTSPERFEKLVLGPEVEGMRALVRRYLPGANSRWNASTACMYTNTPDLDFVLDLHPVHRQVIVASPCSGHGFKFASAVGEILADLATEGESAFDLTPFRLARLLS